MSGPSSDLPPLYTTFTLPHANTLPLYSECPHAHERRVLHSEPSSPMVPNPFQTRQMVYRSDHLEVDLGQFPGAFIHPTYGFNGVIEGTVKFAKKCTYVSQVNVKLEGMISTMVSEYSATAVSGIDKVTLFSHTVQLLSRNDSDQCLDVSAGTCYPFTVSFPRFATVSEKTFALPPSYSAIHPGVSTEVLYSIQVDVFRKGMFRRHEVRKIPVLYLPKSRPPVAPPVELPRVSVDALPDNIRAVALLPNTEESPVAIDSTLPTIHLLTPIPRCFSSGDPIPLSISIRCLGSPALAKLYASNISIQLIKRRRIWVSGRRQISVRETLLSQAIPSGRTECNSGEAYLSFRLDAGAPGRETSWAIDGAIDVLYFIRVIVRPPQDVRHLPIYRVDEGVRLTTEPFDSFDTEEITGEASTPALGLTTLRTNLTPFETTAGTSSRRVEIS